MTDTAIRNWNVTGCREGYTGISKKTGNQFTIYDLQVENAEGEPLEGKFKAFSLLGPGLREYHVSKRDEGEFGVSYTLSVPGAARQSGNGLAERVTKVEERVSKVENVVEEMATTTREFAVPAGVAKDEASSDPAAPKTSDDDIPF